MNLFSYVALLLISLTASGQFFSGEVYFTYNVISKKSDISSDSLMKKMLGNAFLYRLTDGYYKTHFLRDEKTMYTYTYHRETKFIYDHVTERPYIAYRDSRKGESDLVRSTVYKDSIIMVAGYRCFMVQYDYGKYTKKGYYSDDWRVNPESFPDHVVGNWYAEISKVNGSFNLKSVTEYPDRTEIVEAVKITPKEFSRKDFELPVGLPLVASFVALDQRVMLKPLSMRATQCYKKKVNAAPVPSTKEIHTSYVRVVVDEKGALSNIEPHEKDSQGFYAIAVDIVKSCGLEFKPGEIDGKAVSSEAYVPVKFN